MHPMDLIKTRFQLQSNELWCTNPKMQYTGIGDCMKKVITAAVATKFNEQRKCIITNIILLNNLVLCLYEGIDLGGK